MKNLSINKNTITQFILLLYFISISAFQLGIGFDAYFVRIIFIILIGLTLISYKKIILNGQIKWCLLFWGWYFLSMIWAKDYNDTLYYLNRFVQILGISICLPLLVKSKEDVNKTLHLIVLSILVTAIVLIIKTPNSAWGTERVGSAIGLGPNDLGMKMGIGAVISLYLIHNINNGKNRNSKKILYILCIILFSAIAMFSGSKKALFILVAGLIGFEILATKGIKLLLKICAIFLLLYGSIFLIMNNNNLYSVLGRRIEKTILTITGQAGKKDIDTSLTERQFYIEQAIKLFKNNILIGYGGNNFVTYMREISYRHIAYSHNNFTEMLCTLGILGFLIYYSMWIYLLIILFKNYRRYKSKTELLFILILTIILIMDYANVSYFNEFNMLLFILAYLTMKNYNLKGESKICLKEY